MKKIILTFCFLSFYTFSFANTNNNEPKKETPKEVKNIDTNNSSCTIELTEKVNEITITVRVTAPTCGTAVRRAAAELQDILEDYKP